jgi:hypothetical protein
LEKKSGTLLNDEGQTIATKTTNGLSFAIADETYDEITNNFSKQSFSQPLLESIEGMSIINLANFAASLVGIQALSTYSESGAATVGGFIEVVTINRADGVTWHQKIGQPKVKKIERFILIKFTDCFVEMFEIIFTNS